MNAFIVTRSHAIPVGTSAGSLNLTRPSTYGIVLKYFLLDTVLIYEVRMLCVSSTKCQVRQVSEYERHLHMILIIGYLMGLLKDCGDSEFNVGVMNNMTDYAKRHRVEWKSIWLCKHKQLFEWPRICRCEDFLHGGTDGKGSCCRKDDQIWQGSPSALSFSTILFHFRV